MPAKKMPNNDMKDILVIDKFDDIRLIMSEKHNRILRLVTENELSVSDIARSLGMNPGSAHYYLKDLERHGLVKQVREEIKGGIVKKFYRSAAKRIVLEPPDFSSREYQASTSDYMERLIQAIEYLGYHLPVENCEDAKDLLTRYDKRMKSLLIEMEKSGLDDMEDNGMILDSAFNLVLGIKAKNDPELNRLYGEFEKLFLRYE